MSVTYQLTRKDIFYAYLAMLFQQPVLLTFFALLFLFISYQNWTGLPAENNLSARLTTFFIFELISIVFLGGIVVVVVLLSTFSRRNKTMLTKQTLTLADNSMICESEHGRTKLKLTELQRIVRTRNYIFLYLAELNTMIIPRRAFDSMGQWENFIQHCISRSRANK